MPRPPATIPGMDIEATTPLLGGLSPAQFTRRHWQKKPLLIRQAWPGVVPPITRAALFELAGQEGVESRLVTQEKAGWRLRHGPFARRTLPATTRAGWTLLVQGLDLHVQAAHEMLQRFRFVPEARLDDLMISYASDGGGVGPHLDSYDVFLLQVHGRRRWRIGPAKDRTLVEGLPVKILANFEPDQEFVLEPGDMLYLPPLWGHDGIAEGGDCMTCSIGFRAESRADVARELLQRLADDIDPELDPALRALYRDPAGSATATPGALPGTLHDFAREALERVLNEPQALERALGSWLSEPKSNVWFETPDTAPTLAGGLRLDRRTRMMYDARHVFINGEAFDAGGRDAALMRTLADARCLPAAQAAKLSAGARELVAQWAEAGWLHDD